MDIASARVAVIGATGVLGGHIASQLSQAGASVHLVTRSDAPVGPELSAFPRARADIANRDELEAALTTLGGHFDCIINAGGVVAFGAIDEVPADVVTRLFAANAAGTINALAAARKHLADGGVFASLTGVAADVAVLGMSAYCASKAAAKMAMAVAAREWRKAGLRVLDIRAPHTETGLVERALWGEAPRMPAGKSPADVAARVIQAIVDGEPDLPAEAF